MIKCVVRRQAPWGCGLWGGGGNSKEWLNTNNTIGIIRALRSGTHESIRERAHLCLLPCPTGDEAGDDARFIIDDEAYDSLNVTKIQQAIIEQCDSVSSDTSEKEMTFGFNCWFARFYSVTRFMLSRQRRSRSSSSNPPTSTR